MTRQEYLDALEDALIAAGVRDHTRIVQEYARHFDTKYAYGYGEEETAATLAPPEVIAGQYTDIAHTDGAGIKGRPVRAALIAGFVLLDIVLAPVFILLFAVVAALCAVMLSGVAAGICCAAAMYDVSIGGVRVLFLPEMPYVSALLIGFAVFAFAALALVVAVYCCLYAVQLLRKYLRWHKKAIGKGVRYLLPLPVKPWIGPMLRKALSLTAVFAAILFGAALAASFVSMVIASGTVTPWVTWRWFTPS